MKYCNKVFVFPTSAVLEVSERKRHRISNNVFLFSNTTVRWVHAEDLWRSNTGVRIKWRLFPSRLKLP